MTRLPAPVATLGALVGGAALAVAFPTEGVWWLAAPAVALLLVALRGRSVLGAAGMGLVFGLTFYLGLIDWISAFLGPLPLWALSGLQAAYLALGSVLLMLAQRWWPARWSGARRLLGLPWLLGGLWLARDLLASHFPYGGFAWGRLGQSQADAPWAGLVSWVGLDGVTLLVAVFGAVLAELSWAARRLPWRPVAVWAAIVVVAALVPVYRLPVDRTMTVAAAQGGTEKAGFFKGGTAQEVRDAHARASQAVAPQLQGRRLGLLVWPEGAAAPDPLSDVQARTTLTELSRTLAAPVLAGAIHDDDSHTTVNTAQLWHDGGMVSRYDKRRPVPFGEYVPDRGLWQRFAPEQLGLITREYSPGRTPAVVRGADLVLGVGICFDVVDDALARESVAQGAQLMIYPTNNADFGRGDELAQQATFARLRALETGRAVVQASTVGWTVAYGPDGRDLGRLPWYTEGALVVDVPLVHGRTPAAVVAVPLAWGAAVLGLLLLPLLRWWPRVGPHGGGDQGEHDDATA